MLTSTAKISSKLTRKLPFLITFLLAGCIGGDCTKEGKQERKPPPNNGEIRLSTQCICIFNGNYVNAHFVNKPWGLNKDWIGKTVSVTRSGTCNAVNVCEGGSFVSSGTVKMKLSGYSYYPALLPWMLHGSRLN